jgi:tRNA threonylcarbamoyladenosine biosynthesis protein TsaB
MFRILSLETSGLTGSVAAAADGKVLAELQLDPQRRSAQSLAPAIKSILEQLAWRPSDVQLLAMTIGPGSFTGLRVGVATAKVFAYAAGAEVLGVSTLETIAAAAPESISSVSAAIDAQRGDVVAQLYRRGTSAWLQPSGEPVLLTLEQWLRSLPHGCAISGPALKKMAGTRPNVAIVDPEFWTPTAANVAKLAHRDYQAGRRDDLWSLLPWYSRPSAAEEKWGKHGKL